MPPREIPVCQMESDRGPNLLCHCCALMCDLSRSRRGARGFRILSKICVQLLCIFLFESLGRICLCRVTHVLAFAMKCLAMGSVNLLTVKSHWVCAQWPDHVWIVTSSTCQWSDAKFTSTTCAKVGKSPVIATTSRKFRTVGLPLCI